MEKTWKPATAGILNIITGAINALGAIGVLIALLVIGGGASIMQFLPPQDVPFIAPLIGTILIVVLVIQVIEAVFPIVGGVFAL